MTDTYEPTAELHDVLMAAHWRDTLAPAVRAALGTLPDGPGPVLDAGAGTGLAVLLLGGDPSVRVLALEPSRAMRTVLLSRVAVAEDLRARVTVRAERLQDADLPEGLRAVVCLNMIGHLSPEERQQTWARLAARMVPDAPIVVGLQPPARPEPIAQTPYTRVRVGALDYEGLMAATPTGPDRMRWRMTYRIWDGDVVVAEDATEHDWWTLAPDDLAAEAALAGLSCAGGAAGVHVLRAR